MQKTFGFMLAALLTTACLACAGPSSAPVLQAHIVGPQAVQIDWQAPPGCARAVLLRSTTDLRHLDIDPVEYPIQVDPVNPDHPSRLDDGVADDVTYYYELKVATADGRVLFSNVAAVTLPDRPLPELSHPSFHIDKHHYYLEVRDGGQPVKRYPVALGRDPVGRKLHQDNSTTPEGFYHISGVNPKATYYRAYDVDYPNPIDSFRYDYAARNEMLPDDGDGVPDIGGEIQIHGGRGISRNWTFGCIALRDRDIDELFSHAEIAKGTPIEIVGSELSDDDLHCILRPLSDDEWNTISREVPDLDRDAPQPELLARYQRSHGLPVTGQLDTRTINRLLGSQIAR